jgi:hypothetical protein
MAKKKKGLAAYKKRTKKNTQVIQAKGNPPPMQDVMEFILPGFAGYAGTRLASRIVHGVVIKKYPKLAKHASVLSTFTAAAGAWLAVHRIEKIKQYHTPVVVGAGIAALQTAVQAYLPKYGWMVSDHNIKAKSAAAAAAPIDYKGHQQSLGPAPSRSETSGTALPPPIEVLTPGEIADELEELDMGVLGSNIGGDLSDMEMDMMIDDANFN